MNAKAWQELKTPFQAALELGPAERVAYLASSCNGDDELRHRVEKLLASHDEPGAFLVSPALAQASVIAKTKATSTDDEANRVGERIGLYEIIREIGRGGMGTVYLAARADKAFDKQVALKLIKRGMDSDAIIKRFVMERQILANLDHPNIARLIDGGTTEDGCPISSWSTSPARPSRAIATSTNSIRSNG